MMKVAFLTVGTFPVPATKGGAVENLIEDLLDQNEAASYFEFTVLSLYEERAWEKSKKYKNSNFYFFKCPKIIKWLDKRVYWIAKNVLKKRNLISYRYILQRLYVMSKYPRVLLDNDYDRIILVTNSTLFFVLKNKKVAKKYKGKVIYYLHNEVRSLFRCEKEASSIRSLIGISKYVNFSFRKKVSSLKDEQCYVLKNGVDIQKFMNKDEKKIEHYRNKFGISVDDFVVIFAGRLVDEKGALETIKAVKNCEDEAIKLLIVGSGFYSGDVIDDYTLELEREAKDIGNRVIFTGYIDYEDMASIYHLGSVAVLPSMWEEPAGMTMVEAVVSGLPLITTNSGGVPEYIPSNASIILNRDKYLVDNIRKEIMMIKDNPRKFDGMIQNGKQLADEYNLNNYYHNFVSILTETSYEKSTIN